MCRTLSTSSAGYTVSLCSAFQSRQAKWRFHPRPSQIAIHLAILLAGPLLPLRAEPGTFTVPKELRTLTKSSGFVLFSPDGKKLAGSVSGKTWRATDVRIWDLASGKPQTTLQGHTGGIWQMSFSPDGKLLATNDNYSAIIWDLAKEKQLRTIKLPAFTRSIRFLPDGKQIVTGHDDGRIRFWDINSGQLQRAFRGHTDWVPSLVLSHDGKLLVSASVDMTARIWDLQSGKQLKVFRGHKWYLNSVDISPDGRQLVTGSDDSTAKIWDVGSGSELFTLRGHNEWVRRVAFSKDGKYVVTGGDDKTARIWDAKTGKLLHTISAHAERLSGIAFSPDGRTLATASGDSMIKLWSFPADRRP